MSTLQQRPHGIGIGGAPEPDQARAGEHDGGERSQSGGHRPPRPLTAPLTAWSLARYAALGVLVFVLFAGYWKPHPLPSLALPAAALVLWWPVIRARQAERWLFFYIGGIYLYTVLRAFADDLGVAIQSDYVIAIDKFMFLGNVPSVELQRTLFRPWDIGLIDMLAVATHWSFFVVPHAVFAYLWFFRRSMAPAYGKAMLLTLYLGLLLFWLVPTMPPWLAGVQGDLVGTYRVMNFVTSGIDANAYRDLYGTLAAPNSVASVPSIHMALTFLVLLSVREHAPRWTMPLVIYNVAMAFSLVYLGEHYVFDLLMGMLVATVGHYALRSRILPPEPPMGPRRTIGRRPVPVPVQVAATEGEPLVQFL